MKREARATARANIALAKYWGKADAALNLPAVPSVSMTLDPLLTQTRVSFVDGLAADSFLLGGHFAEPEETARVTKLLDRVRSEAGLSLRGREQQSVPDRVGLGVERFGFLCAGGGCTRGRRVAVRSRRDQRDGAPSVGVRSALGVRRLRRAAVGQAR